jgi:hypothetical protein
MPPAQWYPDPANPALMRWWDGTAWTEHTHPVAAPSPVRRSVNGQDVVEAGWIASGWVPTACTAHQRPARVARKVSFISRTSGWVYLALLAGLLPFLIIVYATRRTVVALAWPLCDECVAHRRRWLGVMVGALIAIIPVALLGGLVPSGSHNGGLIVAITLAAFVGCPLLAAVAGILGSYSRLVRGTVTADGAVVAFPEGSLRTEATPAAAGLTRLGS